MRLVAPRGPVGQEWLVLRSGVAAWLCRRAMIVGLSAESVPGMQVPRDARLDFAACFQTCNMTSSCCVYSMAFHLICVSRVLVQASGRLSTMPLHNIFPQDSPLIMFGLHCRAFFKICMFKIKGRARCRKCVFRWGHF